MKYLLSLFPLFACILLLNEVLRADEKAPFEVSASVGIMYHTADNDYISPLVYRGAGPALCVEAVWQNEFMLLRNTLLLSTLSLNSNKSEVVGTKLQNDFVCDYCCGVYLHTLSGSWGRLSMGAMVDMHTDFYRLTSSKDQFSEKRYEFGHIGSGPALHYDINLGRHFLFAGFRLPVAGYVVRREWYLFNDMLEKNVDNPVEAVVNCGEYVYIDELIKLPFESGYSYQLNGNVSVKLTYLYTYLAYKKPRLVKSEYQILTCGIEVKF